MGASATSQTCLAKSTLCKEGDPGGLPLAQTHGSLHPGWAGSPSKPHCSDSGHGLSKLLHYGTCEPHHAWQLPVPLPGCAGSITAPVEEEDAETPKELGQNKNPPPPAARLPVCYPGWQVGMN